MKVGGFETPQEEFSLFRKEGRCACDDSGKSVDYFHVDVVSGGLVIATNHTLAWSHISKDPASMIFSNVPPNEPRATTQKVVKTLVQGT